MIQHRSAVEEDPVGQDQGHSNRAGVHLCSNRLLDKIQFLSRKRRFRVSLADRTCLYGGLSFWSALKQNKFAWMLLPVIGRDRSGI